MITKILVTLCFVMPSVSGFSQSLKFSNAAAELLHRLDVFDETVKDENLAFDPKFPNHMACLTGIVPAKSDGNFFGAIYSPTTEEIFKWRNWVKSNRYKISYAKESQEIMVEYEPGKFRSTNCD